MAFANLSRYPLFTQSSQLGSASDDSFYFSYCQLENNLGKSPTINRGRDSDKQLMPSACLTSQELCLLLSPFCGFYGLAVQNRKRQIPGWPMAEPVRAARKHFPRLGGAAVQPVRGRAADLGAIRWHSGRMSKKKQFCSVCNENMGIMQVPVLRV